MNLDPQQIIAILGVVQALGSQIGGLLSLAKDGGATDEQIQAAYDDAHARAMAYTPLTPADVPPVGGGTGGDIPA
jgi:hypothetical protein